MLVLLLIMLGFRRLRDLDYCRDGPNAGAGSRVGQDSGRGDCVAELGEVRRRQHRQDARNGASRAGFWSDCKRKHSRASPWTSTARYNRPVGMPKGPQLVSIRARRGHGAIIRSTARSLRPTNSSIFITGPAMSTIPMAPTISWRMLCSSVNGCPTSSSKLARQRFLQRVGILDSGEHHVKFSCSVPFERFPELKHASKTASSGTSIDDNAVVVRDRLEAEEMGRAISTHLPEEEKPSAPRDRSSSTYSSHGLRVRLHCYRHEQNNLGQKCRQIPSRTAARRRSSSARPSSTRRLDVVAGKRRSTNRVFTLTCMLAHNLLVNFKWHRHRCSGQLLPTRPARWSFLSLGTIRQRLLRPSWQTDSTPGRTHTDCELQRFGRVRTRAISDRSPG